jgi:hypothetical protein
LTISNPRSRLSLMVKEPAEKYLRKGKLLEYVDTIKACVLEMDKLLYK